MKRARGRPRSFDDEEVKALIMREFWQRGYSATSLDDIVAATGLPRPSLYGAFGNKLDMYLMSLDVFGAAMRDRAARALQQGDTVDTALTGFYREALRLYLGDATTVPLGCLVYTTAVAEAVSHPEIRAKLDSQIKSLETALRRRLTELCPDLAKSRRDAMVDLAVATLHSLAIRSRSGARRTDLNRLINSAVAAIDTIAGS